MEILNLKNIIYIFLKNSLEARNNRMQTTEESVNKLEDRATKILNLKGREKQVEKN